MGSWASDRVITDHIDLTVAGYDHPVEAGGKSAALTCPLTAPLTFVNDNQTVTYVTVVPGLSNAWHMTTLSTHELTVRDNGQRVLDNISFSAKGGELVAVVGANGAGKSTLLAALAGLLRFSSRAVRLNGVSLRDLNGVALATHCAYLPQNALCKAPVTVERLMAFGLMPMVPLHWDLPESFESKIEAALAACDLLSRRRELATTLSEGEQARAMLAQALIKDYVVLILDEPTARLDPRHALDTAIRLRALAHSGKLVIVATHDLTWVARHATRVLALKAGSVVADGPVDQALTPELLQVLFGVDAQLARTGRGAFVDYAAPELAVSAARAAPGGR